MAPEKKGGQRKTKGFLSSIRQAREDIINIHKHISGVELKQHVPQAFKEIEKFTMKETGAVDNTLNKAVRAKGKQNVSYLSLYGCPESSKCYFSQCTGHLKKSQSA